MINRSEVEQFQRFLEEHDIFPNEKIGQHFLIDPEALELIAGRTLTGGNIIEIGSGIGNLTVLLAQRAQTVLGLEIDRQFEPVLTDVAQANPNVAIEFTDALKIDYADVVGEDPDAEWQIVSNPPYHISEPLLKKIAGVDLYSAVLLVGDKLAAAMTAETPDCLDYTKTSFITQAFFHPDVIASVPKSSFYPEPRTQSNVVELTPRQETDARGNRRLAIQRQLASSENQQATVVKAIKTAMDSMETGKSGKSGLPRKDAARSDRRAVGQDLKLLLKYQGGTEQLNSDRRKSGHQPYPNRIIESLGLPDEILSRPFSRLDNQAIRMLTQALMDL